MQNASLSNTAGLNGNQLQELLQWVNDEKDARESLQVITFS